MPNPSAVPIAIRFPRVHPSPALAGGKDVFVLCVVAIPEVEVDGEATELVIELGSVVDDVVVPVVAANDVYVSHDVIASNPSFYYVFRQEVQAMSLNSTSLLRTH